MPLNVQLEQRYVKFFVQGLHSNNSTFCLLTRQISTQTNVKRIMYKYNVSYSSLYLYSHRTICRSIRSVWLNQVNQHDRTCANVIDECINIRDNLMSWDSIASKEANDIACYIATA